MLKLVNESPLFAMDQEFMNLFYKKKPTDCILYSEDGIQFKVHKEILSQTELSRTYLPVQKNLAVKILKLSAHARKLSYLMW